MELFDAIPPASIIDFTHAGLLAAKRTVETGEIHLPAKDGTLDHPKYRVIKGFKAGDTVFVHFLDKMTAQTVLSVDAIQNSVTLEDGRTFWRKGLSSLWRRGVWLNQEWKWEVIP